MNFPPSPCSLHPQPFNRSLRNVEAGRFRAAGHNALRRMHTRLAFGKGDVLIDVGSYVGADLLRLAVASPDAHVHSYDPSAPPRLRQNVRQLPQVHLHPVGVGGANRTACFSPPGATASERRGGACVRAQVLDIAHVLSRFEAVALLQLNCEWVAPRPRVHPFLPPRPFLSPYDSLLLSLLSLPATPDHSPNSPLPLLSSPPPTLPALSPSPSPSPSASASAGCEREVIERLTAVPSAVSRVRAIEMQVHPAFSFSNGLTDAQYCELERRLRRDYHLVYRFAYVWELWVHEHSDTQGGRLT
ncbi:hypothetical protein AB1Y20_013518 [Prymnesium parvum]|uniref:Uncharacterized protein n=1 Tax=Prymnesium parvum TaxID=97485 RepID=A0AB34IFQ6_PRYPA